MIEEAESTNSDHIISLAVNQFEHFLSGNSKAKLQKVSGWWKTRNSIMWLKQDIFVSAIRGPSRLNLKNLHGRGRNRAE